jgi:hypothetical protein
MHGLSILESTFNLDLAYADAPADNLVDIFNFSRTPIVFQTIPPPANNAQCMSDPNPASDPDDD